MLEGIAAAGRTIPMRAWQAPRGGGVLLGRVAVAGALAAICLALAPGAAVAVFQLAWTPRAPLPAPTLRHGVVAVGDRIYALGGITSPGSLSFSNALHEYNPATNAWTLRAPMPTARHSFGIAVLNGQIYAIGGVTLAGTPPTPTATTAVEAYDPTTNTWATRAPLPQVRTDLGAAAANGKLYAIGGLVLVSLGGGSFVFQPTTLVEEYDATANAWSAVAPLPEARRSLAAATAGNGRIYAVGGYSGTSNCLPPVGTLFEYTPGGGWTTKSAMPTPREGLGLALGADGRLYAAGGERLIDACVGRFLRRDLVEAYDVATDR